MGLAILRFWNIKKTETDGSSKIELTAQHWFVPVANFQSNASSQQSWTICSKEIRLFLWLHEVVRSIEFGDVSVWQMTAKADDAKAGASGIETFLSNWDKNWSKHYGIKREHAPGQLPGYKQQHPQRLMQTRASEPNHSTGCSISSTII